VLCVCIDSHTHGTRHRLRTVSKGGGALGVFSIWRAKGARAAGHGKLFHCFPSFFCQKKSSLQKTCKNPFTSPILDQTLRARGVTTHPSTPQDGVRPPGEGVHQERLPRPPHGAARAGGSRFASAVHAHELLQPRGRRRGKGCHTHWGVRLVTWAWDTLAVINCCICTIRALRGLPPLPGVSDWLHGDRTGCHQLDVI
jgi:hypothetical protein